MGVSHQFVVHFSLIGGTNVGIVYPRPRESEEFLVYPKYSLPNITCVVYGRKSGNTRNTRIVLLWTERNFIHLFSFL